MSPRKSALLIPLLLAISSVSAADWPPPDLSTALGLPSTTSGGVDVRVWVGGPFTTATLYRIFESNGAAAVERYEWAEISHEERDLRTAKEARHENRDNRRLLKKYYCHSAPRETDSYMWCQVPLKTNKPWSVLLNDMLPDELWKLPDDKDLDRQCGWVQFGGTIVSIELLSGDRHHAVTYFHPDFCCSHVACAIVNHVRHLVEENIK